MKYGPIVWHVTVTICGQKAVCNCFGRRELDKVMDAFIENEIPFDVSWSKSVTE